MPTTSRKSKTVSITTAQAAKALYSFAPWTCVPHQDHVEIEAYVEVTGDWETVAEIRSAPGVDAAATADFIVRSVNDNEKYRQVIKELADALKLCLECDGLTWEAEHEAEIALSRANPKN